MYNHFLIILYKYIYSEVEVIYKNHIFCGYLFWFMEKFDMRCLYLKYLHLHCVKQV